LRLGTGDGEQIKSVEERGTEGDWAEETKAGIDERDLSPTRQCPETGMQEKPSGLTEDTLTKSTVQPASEEMLHLHPAAYSTSERRHFAVYSAVSSPFRWQHKLAIPAFQLF